MFSNRSDMHVDFLQKPAAVTHKANRSGVPEENTNSARLQGEVVPFR